MNWDLLWSTLMQGDIIQAFLLLLIQIVMVIVSIILIPFGFLFQTFIPSLDDGLMAIADMLNMASSYVSWGLNLLAIPSGVIVILVAYYTMLLTVNLIVWAFKVGVLWYRAVK